MATRGRQAVRAAVDVGAALLPGALVVLLSFQAGGFFPTAPAVVAVGLAVVLALRITLVTHPFAGFRPLVAAVVAALTLFAVWTLASATWSHAPGRALIEFDRALLYVLAFVTFASAPERRRRLGWMVRGMAAGIVIVCAAGFISRALPQVWPIEPDIADQRLSFPLTYWNALGLLAALGTVLALHLAASEREPRAARVLGAAAVPLLCCTLLLTFSRGAIAVGAIGIVAYALLARPRGLLSALIAVGPTAAIALRTTYGAEALSSVDPTGPAAVVQGHHVAVTVGLCVLGAAMLRALCLWLDALLGRMRLCRGARRTLRWGAAAAAVVVLVVATLALGAPQRLQRQYDRFVSGNSISESDPRDRLALVGNNGRLGHWRVAFDAFRARPITGSGAGTYQVQWAQHRTSRTTVNDGHSLYIEVLGELGAVGLVLILVFVIGTLAALAARARGPDRALNAAVFATTLVWALHAGVDWDWEMPAVTLGVLALAGAALAARRPLPEALREPPRVARLAVALGCLVLAVTPAQVARSQVRLDAAVRALHAGDCPTSIDAALDSIAAVGARAEGYEVLSYCDVRQGHAALAVKVMGQAVAHDPDDWEFRYALALVRGAAGMDPRPAVRQALALNPLNPLVRDAVRRFDTSSPTQWQKRARGSLLPFG